MKTIFGALTFLLYGFVGALIGFAISIAVTAMKILPDGNGNPAFALFILISMIALTAIGAIIGFGLALHMSRKRQSGKSPSPRIFDRP